MIKEEEKKDTEKRKGKREINDMRRFNLRKTGKVGDKERKYKRGEIKEEIEKKKGER